MVAKATNMLLNFRQITCQPTSPLVKCELFTGPVREECKDGVTICILEVCKIEYMRDDQYSLIEDN